MDNERKVDPNDFKVVELHNSTDFDFTPELGAMFDGRPLFVGKGENRQYPYHVGHRLAENLAKAVMVKGAPAHDPTVANPTGSALWDEPKLESLKNSFLTELYTEEKPIAMSETDKLMQRVAELENLFKKDKSTNDEAPAVDLVPSNPEAPAEKTAHVYQDKQEVIAELEARGITHDKRATKDKLEELLK